MSILAKEIKLPQIIDVLINDDTLTVELNDGRTISVPLAWYPRLVNATDKERKSWRLIGDGYGIYWEMLDEDISVENILMGKPSGESLTSFKKWLQKRKQVKG